MSWFKFKAQHCVSLHAPGFVWLAEVSLGWDICIKVIDSYIDGEGSAEISIFGLTLSRKSGGREINTGALLRYLAEAAWYPQFLLSQEIQWEALNE